MKRGPAAVENGEQDVGARRKAARRGIAAGRPAFEAGFRLQQGAEQRRGHAQAPAENRRVDGATVGLGLFLDRGPLQTRDLGEIIQRDILSALDNFRTLADPTQTAEARALAFRERFNKAMKTVTDLARPTAAKLADDRAALRREAYNRAGLLIDFGNRSELLAVLRGMPDRDRNAAIDAAIKTGDRQILSALHAAHELLVGPTSIPLRSLIEQFVAEAAPVETLKIAKLDEAESYLSMAYEAVGKTAEEMRDLPAEERGERGAQAAREAEAALALALSDLHPGEKMADAA